MEVSVPLAGEWYSISGPHQRRTTQVWPATGRSLVEPGQRSARLVSPDFLLVRGETLSCWGL